MTGISCVTYTEINPNRFFWLFNISVASKNTRPITSHLTFGLFETGNPSYVERNIGKRGTDKIISIVIFEN